MDCIFSCITTKILYIFNGLFYWYLNINFIIKTFINGITNDYHLSKKPIVCDLYYVSHFICNINTDGFTDGKNTTNKKKLLALFCR
jgi:hypothetical protein